MKKYLKITFNIAVIIVLIVLVCIVIYQRHLINIEKTKLHDYQIIQKVIAKKGWDDNILKSKTMYNSKFNEVEVLIIYKGNPKVTYIYKVYNKNKVLGAATNNSDNVLKKSDQRYELE